MSTKAQGIRLSEAIISEAEYGFSRETVVVDINQTITPCLVLGKITLGAATASAITGTGNGTVTGAAKTATSKVGVYTFICVAAATNGGRFQVVNPNGHRLADALVGVAYSGQIACTINDGATDFVVGDSFTITVAAGTNRVVPVNPAAVDGSQVADCIALDTVITGASTSKIGVLDCNAQVNQGSLDFGSLNGGQILTAISQLLDKKIKVRASLT